ncbi:phage tail protein [Microbulbifer taiwanensis]|uniref:Phage tail protein n=1 Tax=Microbulbifer taiwanensis TaxID=986746 RepID=A0ABW1YGD8_9GAMM|nr:phage tail protein [Microbulbifer taiwanensis]
MMLGIPAALTVARGHLDARLDPYLGNNFFVEIDGLLVGSFSAVSGLQSEVQVTEYCEGGVNEFRHQLPGSVHYPRLVLTRGITEIDTLYAWYARVCEGEFKRRDMTVMMLDRRHVPVVWWNVKAALPVKWRGPDFDASRSTQVAVESLELVHRGIVKPILSRAAGAARAGREMIVEPVVDSLGNGDQ